MSLHMCLRLNTGLHFTDDDMEFALEDYLKSSRHEHLFEQRAEHIGPSGWYSSEVMAHAINTTAMRKKGKIEWVLELKPLHKHPELIHTSLGAVCNISNNHWVALKCVAGQIWLLDSLRMPAPLTQNEYVAFINKRKASYPIRLADCMKMQETQPMSQSSSSSACSPLLPMLQDTPGCSTDSLGEAVTGGG